ncbi:hypothetical protein AB6A40_001856 [Gnathostoma spinigerum]|uniref:Phosphatidylinositol glycan anchor biosynthesis class U protein n=1 Tax=Gnathostoma spinigerum TaxID=75299 RepID=A0ABD6E7B0_9BILA
MTETKSFQRKWGRSWLQKRLPTWLIAVALRILASRLCLDALSRRPELVVPQNSYRRLLDGIKLYRNGISPYDGDLFYYQPTVLYVFEKIIDFPVVVYCLFIVADILCSEFLSLAASSYLDLLPKHPEKDNQNLEIHRIPDLVCKCYLLNPISICSCTILSFSVVTNAVMAVFIFAFTKGHLVLMSVLLGLLAHLSLYPAILIGAVCTRFTSNNQRLIAVLTAFLSFIIFQAAGAYMIDYEFHIDATYGFLLRCRDVTPNIGIFWYFFMEVFEQFYEFFVWVFQLNIVIYVVPLSLTLRKNPLFLLETLLLLISAFSPYPTLAEGTVYLSFLPVFHELKKHMRWTLVVGITLATCVVLTPVMWQMWIVTGSGNANFYFAVTLCYCLAQASLLTDLVGAFLRKQLQDDNPEKDYSKCVYVFR